ncbi:hypothetical protein [Dyadobacter psychrotolerans]|uniref:Uncharacterized protein n=1 Tax=Dyadobacter psychrotolerans TaxID=2541721 RepID=A0A4R5DAZ2_9BACT|nr:hypothetical protein [Dyadobacter psychrotolerans]TDE10799.1 hypothetical protein E0F88_27385 [Dyadobacter psychrotolerans]
MTDKTNEETQSDHPGDQKPKLIHLRDILPVVERHTDETKVYLKDRPLKEYTERENELYILVWKKGLTVLQIIERCNPTAEELAWLWNRDRSDLKWSRSLEHAQNSRVKAGTSPAKESQ